MNRTNTRLKHRKDDIFDIIVDGIPDFPIAYLRLIHDVENNIHCVSAACTVGTAFTGRKVVVVGMRLNETIIEQVFYLSSGMNFYDSIDRFIAPKKVTRSKQGSVWVPFNGFGYGIREPVLGFSVVKNPKKIKYELEGSIMLLKNYFNCTEGSLCLYSRFGNTDPNLMQYSLCMGGDFWDENSHIFRKKFKLDTDLPNIFELLNSIPTYTPIDKTNIECFIKLNDYIGSSIAINYSPKLLNDKKSILNTWEYRKYKKFLIKCKFDYRVLKLLNERGFIIFDPPHSQLPDSGFFGNAWLYYFKGIMKCYTEDKYYFNKLKPLLLESKPELIVKSNETIRNIEKVQKLKKDRKSCRRNKIRNPKTGRCVKKTGIIGRELLGK
jgi:hypothetical protein